MLSHCHCVVITRSDPLAESYLLLNAGTHCSTDVHQALGRSSSTPKPGTTPPPTAFFLNFLIILGSSASVDVSILSKACGRRSEPRFRLHCITDARLRCKPFPPLLLAPAVTALSHTSPHTQLTLTSRPQPCNTPVHASFCSLCGVSADNAPVLAPPYSFIPFLVTGLCFVTCNPSA